MRIIQNASYTATDKVDKYPKVKEERIAGSHINSYFCIKIHSISLLSLRHHQYYTREQSIGPSK